MSRLRCRAMFGEKIRGKDNRLVLAVTGGIASGKSVVAQMLELLGAPLIDTDILARWVVEPEKPAWKEIVAYFGDKVLDENGHLDRKKLSDIVFKDPVKRKKLESFTHPAIMDELARQVNEIAKMDPEVIIQAVVPLLIEIKAQDDFHKVLVVHVPKEIQIERLVKRDGITREEAANILKAQMPIDDKLAYADFVIHNENSLEETRRQVKALWEKLNEIQKAHAGEEKP
jgi:dephospho-CoA kinase